jgi:hypothetical protein
MKVLTTFALMLMVSITAFAEQVLVIQPGSQVEIASGVQTMIRCEGGPTAPIDCAGRIKSFVTLMNYCKTSYSTSSCMDDYWPRFIKESSQCKGQALDTCMNFCTTSYSNSSCLKTCAE